MLEIHHSGQEPSKCEVKVTALLQTVEVSLSLFFFMHVCWNFAQVLSLVSSVCMCQCSMFLLFRSRLHLFGNQFSDGL